MWYIINIIYSKLRENDVRNIFIIICILNIIVGQNNLDPKTKSIIMKSGLTVEQARKLAESELSKEK